VLCKATTRVFWVLAKCPKGRKGSLIRFDNNQVGCILWSIYKLSKLNEKWVLIYESHSKSQGVWGCESEGIKGVYQNSKHRVGGNQTV